MKRRILATLAAAALLVAVPGSRLASADPSTLDAPTMTSAQATSQGGLRVDFVDHSVDESGFFIYVYPGYVAPGGDGGPLPIHAQGPPVQGSGQAGSLELTQDYWHFQPGTLYCVSLQAYKNPGPFQADILSDESDTVCAATADAAQSTGGYEVISVDNHAPSEILSGIGKPATPAPDTKPALADLAVVSITGPTTLRAGVSGTYKVTIKNQGGTAAPVELFVLYTGALTQAGQIDSSCELKPPDTGITAVVRCSGTSLQPGQTATVVVQARGQSAGTGRLVASVNPSHTPSESSYDNNVSPPFTVTVN